MSSDALERLKNKSRPVVENRDTSIPGNQYTEALTTQDTPVTKNQDKEVSTTQDVLESVNQDKETSINQNISESGSQDKEISATQDIQTYRNQDKEVSTSQNIQNNKNEDIKTKQTTVRLEVGLSKRLQALCHEEGISRETLIEAMFEFIENNSKARNKILANAAKKNEHRQQIANKRRAKSMMEKFG